MRGQAIRPSQFILVYGVGSIIETPGGPRVLPAFWKWGKKLDSKIHDSKFVIQEDSVSALLQGARIFKIPTNSNFDQMPDSEILFPSIRFPMWALCLKHKKLYYLDSEDRTRCTECLRLKIPDDEKFRHEAIRFIRVCPKGHMDDVEWDNELHKGSSCKNRVFEWEGGQSSLEDVKIKCSSCNAEISLKDVYNSNAPCSRYVPEEEKYDNDCDKRMQVILRSQSSLRIPKLVTVITIPPRDSNAYLLLSGMDIKKTLARKKPEDWTPKDLIAELELINRNYPEEVTDQQIERVKEFKKDEIIDAISKIMNKDSAPVSIEEVMDSEFKALKHGAENGAPPVSLKGSTQFEMDKRFVREISISSGLLRIAPIQRLRTVIVQRGYTRTTDDTSKASLVETSLRKDNAMWYPGIELRGEGLFIDFPDDHELVLSKEGKIWMKKFLLDPKKNKKFHPVFVWWHTLSHAIINILSIDSGYSAASIRERIYFECDNDGTNARGGALLYTSQPSGDGTLGGLIGIASNFERLVDHTRERMQNCSNDPLCSSQTLEKNRINGAVCYACLMLSETSCENSNSLLDRNLLNDVI